MTNQAFLIERVSRESPATAWRAVLWADVPVARQRWYAKPITWTSAYADASPADLAALRAGAMTEKVITLDYAAAITLGEVQTDVRIAATRFQQSINNLNLWNRYGSTWSAATGDNSWATTNNA